MGVGAEEALPKVMKVGAVEALPKVVKVGAEKTHAILIVFAVGVVVVKVRKQTLQ